MTSCGRFRTRVCCEMHFEGNRLSIVTMRRVSLKNDRHCIFGNTYHLWLYFIDLSTCILRGMLEHAVVATQFVGQQRRLLYDLLAT